MVDPEGHTPPVEEGRSHLGESYRARKRARPRSAVTVSLSTPALARLTRSVRVEGRVCPGSGPGTWGIGSTRSAWLAYPGLYGWGILCLTFLCPRNVIEPGPKSDQVPAHFVSGGHGPHRRPSRLWSSESFVGHEV